MIEKYQAAFARMAKRMEVRPGPLETPCHIWLGALDQNGHGNVFIGYNGKGKTRKSITDKAHRVAYIAAHPDEAKPPVVRHKCDVRGCFNQEHLEPGTQLDNIRDMVIRNRQRNQYTRGEPATSLADALAFT